MKKWFIHYKNVFFTFLPWEIGLCSIKERNCTITLTNQMMIVVTDGHSKDALPVLLCNPQLVEKMILMAFPKTPPLPPLEETDAPNNLSNADGNCQGCMHRCWNYNEYPCVDCIHNPVEVKTSATNCYTEWKP